MKEKENIKNKWLHLRLSEAEYGQLQRAFSKTTERKLSKYARKVLLGKPIIAGHRNLSTEKLIVEFATLVKTLNGLANNFNQSVHKLHTLNAAPDIRTWASAHDRERIALFESVETIKSYLKETSSVWLQS